MRIHDGSGLIGRVDFVVGERVVVEFDGLVKYEGPQGRSALAREKAREDRLRAAGYLVLRLVWTTCMIADSRVARRATGCPACRRRRRCLGNGARRRGLGRPGRGHNPSMTHRTFRPDDTFSAASPASGMAWAVLRATWCPFLKPSGSSWQGWRRGRVNTVVGSGTLITFPTLLFFGYPPVVANVSNTVGLVAGGVTAVHGYRGELEGAGRTLRRLAPASLIGGVIGAALLLVLPAEAFQAIVPVLIGLGLVLVVLGPRLQARAVASFRLRFVVAVVAAAELALVPHRSQSARASKRTSS